MEYFNNNCRICAKLRNHKAANIEIIKSFINNFDNCNPIKSIKNKAKKFYNNYNNNIFILNSKFVSQYNYEELPSLTKNDFEKCLKDCEGSPMKSLQSDFYFCVR